MPEPIKRLRYFTGQFLEASDFVTEQNYHLDMRRRGNRGLYLAGILDGGFVVKYLPNEKKIEISAGVAVDAQGRELVVVTSVRESPPQTGIHFLTVSYQEQETDTQTQTGEGAVSDTTRYDETPKVGFFKDGTSFDKDAYIVIAKITVDNAGNVSGIDPSVRQHAIGRFPSSLTVAGNVGIGTTSPAGRLTLNGIVQPNQGRLTFFSSGADVEYDGGTDGTFLFRNTAQNGKTAFVGGNIGIGTANPSAGLEIDKGPTNDVALLLNSSGPGWGSGLQLKNTAQGGKSYGIYSGFGNLHFADVDASVDRLLIHSSGNVGIGTSQPASKLTIQTPEAYGGNTLRVEAKNEPGTYYLNLNTHVTNGIVRWVFDQTNAGTNFPNVLAFDRGNVGIGTATPGGKLEIAGNGGVSIDLIVNGRLKSNNNDGGIWVAADRFIGGHSTNKVGFWNGNTWQLTVQSDGNVGIGTTTPKAKLEVPGGGILNGLAIGVDPPPIPGVGDITFPFPYETIGTIDPRLNLRLHSNGSIVFHTGNSQGQTAAIDRDGHVVITGNIGTSGRDPNGGGHFPSGWGGGVHTFDVIAEGSVWCQDYMYCRDATVKRRDLAENYYSDLELEAGDVVCLDSKDDQIVKSERANDELLLGVISTNPGLLLGGEHGEESGRNDGKRAYPVALSGRVPCKVTDENGPISRGDALTSSSTPGHAMKAMPFVVGGVEIYAPGTIIGKALESLSAGTGIIEIFVTLK